tara:strand:+ start:67 stop:693 length:627 start_codon:yes stop_codon:yes gene_type:complete
MKYEEIELTIPTDWNDITIGMYQDFVRINKKKFDSDEERTAELICALCKVEQNKLERFKYKDLKYIVKKISKLMDSEIDDKTLVKKLDFKGSKLGLIPNFSSITLGEFVDIEDYCKDAYSNLHKLMSVMYRPIVKEKGDRYKIEEYSPDEFKAEEYLDFPIVASMSSLSFFFHLGKQLKLALLKYSSREVEKKIKRLERLQRSGVGIM